MKYAILASGSKGNSTLLCSAKTKILIDCGLSKRNLMQRLDICGVTLADIAGVFVTHAHSDHTAGLKFFQTSSLYAPLFVIEEDMDPGHILTPFETLYFEDIKITPLPLSHDSANTVGFLIEEGDESLCYITDTGFVPERVLPRIANCNYYIFESNHDPKMLWESGRPPELIRRISGDYGHLSNIDSAYYLAGLIGPKTTEVTLAHLSEECNTKERALDSFAKVMCAQLGAVPSLLLRCADEQDVYKGGDWNRIRQ